MNFDRKKEAILNTLHKKQFASHQREHEREYEGGSKDKKTKTQNDLAPEIADMLSNGIIESSDQLETQSDKRFADMMPAQQNLDVGIKLKSPFQT